MGQETLQQDRPISAEPLGQCSPGPRYVPEMAGTEKINRNLVLHKRLTQLVRRRIRRPGQHDHQRVELVAWQAGDEFDQLALGSAVTERGNAECGPQGQEFAPM